MSNYKWCHGPNCHTYSTQDRVRGSKGSKVLRTRKINQNVGYMTYDPNNYIIIFVAMVVTTTLLTNILNK